MKRSNFSVVLYSKVWREPTLCRGWSARLNFFWVASSAIAFFFCASSLYAQTADPLAHPAETNRADSFARWPAVPERRPVQAKPKEQARGSWIGPLNLAAPGHSEASSATLYKINAPPPIRTTAPMPIHAAVDRLLRLAVFGISRPFSINA